MCEAIIAVMAVTLSYAVMIVLVGPPFWLRYYWLRRGFAGGVDEEEQEVGKEEEEPDQKQVGFVFCPWCNGHTDLLGLLDCQDEHWRKFYRGEYSFENLERLFSEMKGKIWEREQEIRLLRGE